MIFNKFGLFLIVQLFVSNLYAEADGPDYWSVTGVIKGSYLNIRLGPSVKFSIIGKIPADFKHLDNIACSPEFTITEWEKFNRFERKLALELRWCKIKYNDLIGWVYAYFLTEGISPEIKIER